MSNDANNMNNTNNGTPADGASDGEDSWDLEWAAEDFVTLHKGMSLEDVRNAIREHLSGCSDFHLTMEVYAIQEGLAEDSRQPAFTLRKGTSKPEYIWSPKFAASIEHNETLRVGVKFRDPDAGDGDGDSADAGEWDMDRKASFGDGLLRADWLGAARLLSHVPDSATPGLFALIIEPFNIALPFTDDSIIRFRIYGSGDWNCIDILSGSDWRERHSKYAMFYRNDDKDLPLIQESIALYEKQLRMLIDTGANPRIALGD